MVIENWKIILDKDPELVTICPEDILKFIHPKLVKPKEIGILDESVHIKSFQQFNDSRVWEPKRKEVVPHNMPNIARQNDYIITVKEEIENTLRTIYQFDQKTISEIQNKIWLELKSEWQDVLDDSLVNWDTPSVCAQKCLMKLKPFIPFMENKSHN